MDTRPQKQQITGASGINILLGVWLLIAPFVLGFSNLENATWNHIIVGIAVAVLAAMRAFGAARQPGLSWVNVILGVWLILSPFILAYSAYAEPLWNSIILGVLIVILGWTSAAAGRRAPGAP